MSPQGHYEVHLQDYLYILRKRRLSILFFLIASILLGFYLTFSEQVLYRGVSTILIERENPNIVDFKEVMALDASATEYYQTQYQMLKSRTLISELIEKEKLSEDGYFSGLIEGRLRRLARNQPVIGKKFEEFLTRPAPEDVFVRHLLRVDPVRNSRLVEVSVLHPDPVRAAELTNRLVELFIKRNLDDRFLLSKQATAMISKQLEDLKEKVGVAEKNLQTYKEEKGLVSIPSLTEKDKFLQDAKLELVKIQAEEAKLSKRYLPAHPKMIHIRSQIEGLDEKIKEEEQKTLEMSGDAVAYQELDREAESARQIYKALLKRLQETSSEAQTQASNIMVVDKASPPSRPAKPQPVINMLMAGFLGLVGGLFLAFFLEYLDSTVKIPEDIEKGLNLELFGIIPEGDRKSGKDELFFNSAQHSPAAESVRALRTALLFKLRHLPGCRVILLTSPNPEEGKSSLAANLAAAFAQNNLKVVLIDADLRKPRLHKILQVDETRGLCNVLEGEIDYRKAVIENASGLGFDFIPCGGPSEHPTEILGSSSMKQLLENLKLIYDIVILDSSPYLPVADVAVLSEHAAAVLVVARYQKTDKRHLRNLKRRFSDPEIKALGVVINRVSVKEKDYYFHQYYYYGYGDAPKRK